MRSPKTLYALLLLALVAALSTLSCDDSGNPVSASGVGKATIKIPTGDDGLTTEQRNVKDRLVADNTPGAIKHLYVISAYSGQVLIYSTVRGKVTSSGKRLTPNSVNDVVEANNCAGFRVDIGGHAACTTEVLQDDGTYGSSTDYLYWWDTKGVYHQHYVEGGQIVHVSSEPIAVKSIVINMQMTGDGAPSSEPPPPAQAPEPTKAATKKEGGK